MDNKLNNFDDIIRNKLEQLDLSSKLPDWDAFEEKLDATHQENTSFDDDSFVDELAHTKLANQEVAYRPEHWTQMSKRIELDRILTRKLIKYKLIEAVLVVFAIFTFINLFPVRKEIKHNLEEKIEQLQIKINKEKKVIIEKDVPKTITEPSKPIAAAAPRKDAIQFVEIIKDNKEKQQKTTTTNVRLFAKTRNIAPVTTETLPETIPIPTVNSTEIAVVNLDNEKNEASEPVVRNKPVGLAMLSDNSIHLPDNYSESNMPSLVKTKIHKKSVFSFSGIAGIDANYINSPYDNISDVESDTTAAVGYSGGFHFDMQMSRIGIQTGLIYSFKRYQPNTPADILQAQNFRFKEEFKGIELDIVQIPLNIRYDYFIRNKNRLYVLGGATLNTIARANYDILYKQENRLAPPPNPAEFKNATENSDLNKKDFDKGVISGGRFADNAYMTANFSLGLEHYISPRISFFIQPRFQYYFPFQDGIGPNNDKIHAYSFLLGTKVNVW